MDNEENDYKLKQKKKGSYSSKILQGKLQKNIKLNHNSLTKNFKIVFFFTAYINNKQILNSCIIFSF